MPDIKNHKRVNDILLGPLERPALQWLASHVPKWITPDICTLIGILGAMTILIGYTLTGFNRNFLWLASLGFVINWFGDSLDGTLARFRHIERPIYGFFIDHVTDAFCQVLIFLGLGTTPYIQFNIACLTLIAYFLLSVLVYIRTCVVAEFRISYGRLGPTEVRVLAILLNTAMYFFGIRQFIFSINGLKSIIISPYDIFVTAIALLLFYFFLDTAIKESIRLGKENQ